MSFRAKVEISFELTLIAILDTSEGSLRFSRMSSNSYKKKLISMGYASQELTGMTIKGSKFLVMHGCMIDRAS